MTIGEALNQAHHQLMAKDDRVLVIGEDLNPGVFGVTAGLEDCFGADRVINTPISETAFVGMAVGAAMTGLRPIVEIMFADFIGVCFDQLLNQAAKMRFLSNDRIDMPLVVRTTIGAGDHSGAMHSQSLHGLLMQIPGIHVACPSTAADAAGLLKSAIAGVGPTILVEHKGLYGDKTPVDEDLPPVRFGAAKTFATGDDVTVVAVSAMVKEAMRARSRLMEEGISIDVIDPVTIAPLDYDVIAASIAKTGRLLVVDEGAAVGGFADHVVAWASEHCFSHLKAPPASLTPPHAPTPYGWQQEAAWMVDAHKISDKIRTMI